MVNNYSTGRDCLSSLEAVRALGVKVNLVDRGFTLEGMGGNLPARAELDCGNSGTTMRLLMGALAAGEGTYVLDGDESLRNRPMGRVAKPLEMMGAHINCTDDKPPVTIRGGELDGIDYDMPVASAQLKSALLLAGVRASGITNISEPAPSRDHTERMLNLCGGPVEKRNRTWRIRRASLTLPEEFRVPGDASSAAFFLCAAAMIPGSEITADGMLLNSTRIGFLKVLDRMGVVMKIHQMGREPEPWGSVTVKHSGNMVARSVPAKEIPGLIDEIPILALTATQAYGTTTFHGVGELRIKETDRIAAIVDLLSAMGAKVEASRDDLKVEGPVKLQPVERLDSFGDHRMAMTARLAGLAAGCNPEILNEDCVAISYPEFADTLKALLA